MNELIQVLEALIEDNDLDYEIEQNILVIYTPDGYYGIDMPNPTQDAISIIEDAIGYKLNTPQYTEHDIQDTIKEAQVQYTLDSLPTMGQAYAYEGNIQDTT